MPENKTSLIMYTTEDGITQIQATFDNDTVWLSIDQMAELFQRDKSTISRHIKNIFEKCELNENRVVAKFATTATDGKTYQVDYYNLDVIISEGYRVKSLRGTQFRIWVMQILKEYMQKGFALDDRRLKELGGGNYFKMTRREILTTAGRVSHQEALDKAHEEYKKYKSKEADQLSLVEKHFLKSIDELDRIEEFK